MKKIILSLLLITMATTFAQVGINTTTPDPSSMLDISATNKGVLVPRLTDIQKLAIITPATGLLIYQSDGVAGFYYYNGTTWTPIAGPTTPCEIQRFGNIIRNTSDLTNDNFIIGSTTLNNIGGLNDDKKMFFNKVKGAFRAGNSNNSAAWDIGNVGENSVAFGFNTKATGNASTAMGNDTTASGINSTAMGFSTTASGVNSTTTGASTTASGLSSTATGSSTTASGNFSTAMGIFTSASAINSTAMGGSTTASGFTSTAMGESTTASGNDSTAMGNRTIAAGNGSTAMGIRTRAQSYAETAIGTYNTLVTTPNATAAIATDRLFTVGNGLNSTNLSNAMVVLKNGNTAIGNINPTEKLEVDGKTKTTNLQVTTGAVAGNILTSDAVGNATWQTPAVTPSWSLTGNAATATDFIGTTNNIDLLFKTNNTEKARLLANGNFGIGTNAPNAPLQFSNGLGNRKIVLYEDANNDNQFYGFGINASMLRYQTALTSADHTFFAGTSASGSSELMRIKGNGNVGIGVVAPTEKLDVAGKTKTTNLQVVTATVPVVGQVLTATDVLGNMTWQTPVVATPSEIQRFGNVIRNTTNLTDDNFIIGSTTLDEDTSIATDNNRMFFNKTKGAFRAGNSDNTTKWNDANVGDNSVAFGFNTTASAFASTSMGSSTLASGDVSTAMGRSTLASANVSTAMGASTTASAFASTSMGSSTLASGNVSTAMGLGTRAQSLAETVIGSFNTLATSPSTTGFIATDRLFTIGNGANSGALSNAMVVLKNGRVGLGNITPGGQFELSLDEGRKPGSSSWTVVSDKRLKIINGKYSSGLNEIIQLNPIRYNYKNTGERKFEKAVLDTEFTGFIAQEVQPLFPDAVKTDPEGYLNFNMHSILVASVNAFKELNEKNKTLEKQNNALQKELESQKSIMNAILVRLEKIENSVKM